jgi:serine/threonine protein kinase
MIATNTLLLDRYLVMHLLGQGGMGAVYKATDRKFGNTVAIKETFYSDHRLREAFALEARLLNRLRHAALPVVTDYFSEGEGQYLVMQYIPGRDMEQLLAERQAQNQGPFLAATVLRWADQLLDALDYLHSQTPSIIHRDIKPQNLKLTPRGEVILLDFGLAKGVTGQPSGNTHSIRGYTPNYSPLEQIRGTGTDRRSDIYSVGATLYHLLTGEMSQDAATRTAAMLMGEPDPLPSISVLNPEVAPAVAAAIEKAMSLYPEERYASAASMRMALRNAGRSIVAPPNFHRAPTLTDGPAKNGNAGHIVIELAEGKRPAVKAKSSAKSFSGKEPRSIKKPEERRSKPASRSRTRSRIHLSGGAIAAGIIIFAAWFFFFQEFGSTWAFARRYLPSEASGAQVNVLGGTKASSDQTGVVESLRYYLEINSDTGVTKRETGREPLANGTKFRFHFKPTQSGYLYVVGTGKGSGSSQPGETDQTMPAAGVVTNRVEAGDDLQVPYGDQWYQIDRDSDKTPFTIIFSPTQVKTLDFLTAASGRPLTDIERKDLDLFKRDISTLTPNIIATQDDNQPTVAVRLPEKYSDFQPVIFGIDIKKR